MLTEWLGQRVIDLGITHPESAFDGAIVRMKRQEAEFLATPGIENIFGIMIGSFSQAEIEEYESDGSPFIAMSYNLIGCFDLQSPIRQQVYNLLIQAGEEGLMVKQISEAIGKKTTHICGLRYQAGAW